MPDIPTPRQAQTWALRLAHAFKDPASQLEVGGKKFFTAVRKVDQSIGGLRALATMAGDELGQSINSGLDQAVAGFADVSEAGDQTRELLESLRPAELISVPLRKAIVPARRGLTLVTDSIRIVEGWQAT